MTGRKQQGQGSGAAAVPPTDPHSEPAGSAPSSSASGTGAAPKFCPSCGASTRPYQGGKGAYCEACEHVFDAGGQGRRADFADQLADLREQFALFKSDGPKDPRVDKLDAMIQKLSEAVTGERKSINDLNPDDPIQVGKLSTGLAFLKGSLSALFAGRPRPAAPATPPAQGAGK